MTEDDKDALKEFLGGAAVVAVVGLFILFVILLGKSENPPVESQSIKVVGTYKDCDILRYVPPSGAKYQYFMDCNK